MRRFSLETHAAPYEQWPLKTPVLLDGQPTPAHVPGNSRLHQFWTPQAYLLVTDCDCPFEEATSFILLSQEMRPWGIPYLRPQIALRRLQDAGHG